jgi:DNA primase
MTTDRLAGRKTLKVDGFLEELEKEEIKSRVDIVDVFSSFGVKLVSKGKGFTGKCPWHEDKNPSLSVDRQKGLYHCFGCGESGDVVSLVEKMKGVGFREALSYLKSHTNLAGNNGKTHGVAQRRTPQTSAAVPAESSGAKTDMVFILDEVAARYASSLQAHPEARAYLASRGLDLPELASGFTIGYCPGTLNDSLSAAQKEELSRMGILKPSGREHMAGCITVPLLDEGGHVAGFYGRRIGAGSARAHLYLSGPHRGLVNRKAAGVYREELVLAESVLDALSLIAAGVPNVIPCYGTGGFTEEHLKLLRDERVKSVVVAFDNDEAGIRGAEKLTAKLLAEGFEVKTVAPLAAKDWNEELVAGTLSKEGVRKLIEASPLRQRASDATSKDVFRLSVEGNRYLFGAQDVSYRVIGVKELFVSSLRVNIRAEYNGLRSIDNVDLYAARSRAAFAMGTGGLLGLEPTRIERDLLRMIDCLEAERDRKLSLGEQAPRPMSAEEKAIGLELLESQDIMERIASDMGELGYVNEEANKKLVYLAAVSRLLPQPLNIYIQAGASGGKSALLSTLERMLPSEAVIKAFTISPQAFHYVNEEGFLGKVFLMGEAIHDESIEAMVRQMQSEGELSRLVTLKDPKSGEYKTHLLKKPVRMSFMVTSTALQLHPENASRCLTLTVDESAAQTQEVQKWMGKRRSLHGRARETERILARHQAAQRLMEPLCVTNPLAPRIRFPKERPTMRRAFEQFLTLMDAACLLRQKRKEIRVISDEATGKEERFIQCDLEDYRVAHALFMEGVFRANAEDIPAATRRLYEVIRAMLRTMSREQGVEMTQVSFIQKDLREYSKLGGEFIKKHLRFLVDYEYLQITRGKLQGTRFSYRLREDSPLEDMDSNAMSTPEELAEALRDD